MFKMYVYKGGIYRHEEIVELIEDLGGIIMQKTPMQTEVDIVFALPESDRETILSKSKKLKGEIIPIPFGDMEVAIVAPSLSRHHLPHPVCDISEFLRRYGATTNIIGLARGYGKTIFQISDKERKIIAEHDAAIFSFGMFEKCIISKEKEVRNFNIPYVVCGGPQDMDGMKNYVGNVGRKANRMREPSDISTLGDIKNKLLEMVEAFRVEIGKDPPVYPPVYIKRSVEEQLGIKGTLGDNPVVLHLNGIRVKKPYSEYKSAVENVKIGNYSLKDISAISKSEMSDTIIVTMRSVSEIGVDGG